MNGKKSVNKLFLDPAFYLPLLLFAGRSSLERIGIPIDTPLSLMFFISIFLIILIIIQKKRTIIIINTYDYLFFLFLILCLISTLYSVNVNSAIIKAGEVFCIFLLLILMKVCIKEEKNLLNLIYGFVFLSFILLLLSAPNLLMQSFNSIQDIRLSALGGGPNIFARFMFIGLLSSLIVYTIDKKQIYLFLSIFFLIGIFFTGSRGAYLGTIFSLLTFISIIKLTHINMKTLFNWKAWSTITLVSTFMFFVFGNKLKVFFEERLLNLISDSTGGAAVSVRKSLINEAVFFIQEKPIVGIGLNSFPELSDFNIYPHNLLVEVFVELGIIGITLILFIIIISIASYVKIINRKTENTNRNRNFYIYGLIMCVFLIITTFFSGDLFDSRFLFVFLYMPFLNYSKYNVGNEKKVSY